MSYQVIPSWQYWISRAKLWTLLRDVQADSQADELGTGPSIFVVGYPDPALQRRITLYLFTAATDIDSAPPAQPEAETGEPWRHQFIRSQWITPTYGLGGSADNAVTSAPEAETQPHFTGQYRPSLYNVLTNLRFQPDTSQSAPEAPTQPESFQWWHRQGLRSEWRTPLYGLGGSTDVTGAAFAEQSDTLAPWRARPLPNAYRPFPAIGRLYWWQGDLASDALTQPGSPEAMLFITYEGREYVYRRDLLFSDRFDQPITPVTPESETNTSTVGRYHPFQSYTRWAGLYLDHPDTTFSGPPEPETNPHSRFRYRPSQHFVARGYLFRLDLSSTNPFITQVEVNPHVQLRFTRGRHLISRHLLFSGETSESAPVSPRILGKPTGLEDHVWHQTILR